MKISAAMIIKRGETAQLSKCLESIRPYVSEIVGVVDPRGSDDTDSVLRSYGARKVDHIWTGDYAEARNISIENVIGDYIFVIDTDEYVTEFKFIPDEFSSLGKSALFNARDSNDITDCCDVLSIPRSFASS